MVGRMLNLCRVAAYLKYNKRKKKKKKVDQFSRFEQRRATVSVGVFFLLPTFQV